ncbi:hypothetical protein D3C72_1706240 [compost metagenome]
MQQGIAVLDGRIGAAPQDAAQGRQGEDARTGLVKGGFQGARFKGARVHKRRRDRAIASNALLTKPETSSAMITSSEPECVRP